MKVEIFDLEDGSLYSVEISVAEIDAYIESIKKYGLESPDGDDKVFSSAKATKDGFIVYVNAE